ncbi:MAG: hypothetical protein LBJ20_01460, partial [Candidatus Methanoplasma sp.]|nr:hypothetical protein [Candidatus Methanoplasma sp.]
GVPYGTSGSITASITGYTQAAALNITSLASDLTNQNIALNVDMYAVTLTPETGISGFRYSIDGGPVIFSSGLFYVPHGSDLIITAVLSGGYAFVSWSGDSDSRTNPLTLSSVTGDISLEASGELIKYYVTFDSGFNYTVYVNGSAVSSVSSDVGVTGGGSLSFTVRTSQGYSASPDIKGMADLIEQSNGSYMIQNVHSNISVTITVSADSDSEGGNSSENNPDASSGNSSGSGGDSADGVSYWVPVLIVTALLVCIAAAAAGHTVLKRRRE